MTDEIVIQEISSTDLSSPFLQKAHSSLPFYKELFLYMTHK